MDAALLALAPAHLSILGVLAYALTWSLAPFLAWAVLRGPRRGIVALTAGAACLVAVLLQFAMFRDRPEVVGAYWATPSTPSFPSGHAAVVFAVAALEWMRGRRGLMPWAIAIAASRVVLQHHFPSDVIVGATIGGAMGLLAYGAFFAEATRRPRWSWWLWPQLSVVVFATFAAYLSLLKYAWLAAAGVDKVMHFVLYGLLSLLLSAFVPRRKLLAVAILFVLATVEEFLQGLSPARTFDLLDLACTLSGIVLGGGFGIWRTRRAYAGSERSRTASSGTTRWRFPTRRVSVVHSSRRGSFQAVAPINRSASESTTEGRSAAQRA